MSGFDLFGQPTVLDTGARNAFDYYPTPAHMTRSLVLHHPAIAWSTVLEPCSGGGAITNVLKATGCVVYTNDIDERHEAISHFDATVGEFWTRTLPDRTDWVITNPPFNVAFDILRHAVDYADRGVALLLRKTFLEPTEERGPWLQSHPPTRIIGQPRYSFRGTGSDSVPCDWCIWERRPDRNLPPIVIDYLADQRLR